VVQTGHISLAHRTRRGDATRAWYRGPLVPFPTLRDQPGSDKPQLAHSADQLRRVVPDGREDMSLAAAFEIGRLLGLSQLSVVSALLRFRSEQFGAGRVRELLTRASQFQLPSIAETRIDLGRFVAVKVLNGLTKDAAQRIGPRRPVADPGRELRVRGELDQVIADGLGLDLAAVRKVADQVGIAAALARANVRVSDARAPVANLRTAVDNELASVIAVAAPKTGLRERGRDRTPDPLDELLDRAAALVVEDEEGES
jgi:hypothetical protein